MSKKSISPSQLHDQSAFGASQVVLDEKLGLVFISGQLDWDLQFKTTSNTVEGQTKRALENLKIALEAAGSSPENVLQVRVYVRGELSEHLGTVAPLFRDFFGASPVSLTGIGVASLASPETLVEIEAVARAGNLTTAP